MKKLFALALVLGLMVMASAGALAAVHNFTGDFFNYAVGYDQFSGLSFEGWYSIDKDSPSMTARILNGKDYSDHFTNLGLEYYQNDQFFADLSYFNYDDSEISFQGSYLFKSGWFVGLSYVNDEDDSQSIISPGYRFDLGEHGYAAVSFDYALDGDMYDSGILAYDIDLKYFIGNAKIYTQIWAPYEDTFGCGHSRIDLAANYKINDNFTVGAGYFRDNCDEETDYNVGVTASFDKLGLEARYRAADYSYYSDDSAYDLNVMYSITEKFRAGFQYTKDDDYDDPFYYAKLKYTIDDKNAIRLVYQFQNDSAGDEDGVVFLRWDRDLSK